MKKIILKSIVYAFLMILTLEALVRVFHLGKDTPTRYLDQNSVEKWKPNQEGYAVTGNRRQNFSEYKINSSGFNSYREYNPSDDKIEMALVGDSFIEGFHQPYYNSIGKKIENQLDSIEVYEYGYAGYDFADQLHLTYKYQEAFKDIDYVVLGLKFNNDLIRPAYEVIEDRLALESPLNNALKKSKLLVYVKSIGVISAIKQFIKPTSSHHKAEDNSTPLSQEQYLTYLNNFKSLTEKYEFNKQKYYLMLDERITPKDFLTYLDGNGYQYFFIGHHLKNTRKPVTLIYDKHWNNHGRTIVANTISSFFKEKINDF